MLKRSEWSAPLKDRSLVWLLIIQVVLLIVILAISVFRIQVSDILVPVRYTGYGVTFIYRDQWFSQYGYLIFGLLVAGMNTFFAVKTYKARRMLSLGLMGLTVFLLVMTLIVSNAVINLTPTL